MLKLGIRVSNLEKHGSGHIKRCMAIREYIKNPVYWFLDKPNNLKIIDFPKTDKIFIEKGKIQYKSLLSRIRENKINIVLIAIRQFENQTEMTDIRYRSDVYKLPISTNPFGISQTEIRPHLR